MAAQRKYPAELIGRAVRMVAEKQRQSPGRSGILQEVGDLLGIHPEALRHWVKKAEAQADPQAAAAQQERERIRDLEKEVTELRRANEILKAGRRELSSLSLLYAPGPGGVIRRAPCGCVGAT
ncbi:transposase [Streptomyces sp. NPDC088354]|uniref:transposase n=1 Tax=Streptomyces sp. NPDC088354 TaxID=3365856 RepID=UPI003827264C